MSGVEDLKAAVQAVLDGITNLNATIEQVVAKLKGGGISDADAEALAQQLQTGVQAINDEVGKLQQD